LNFHIFPLFLILNHHFERFTLQITCQRFLIQKPPKQNAIAKKTAQAKTCNFPRLFSRGAEAVLFLCAHLVEKFPGKLSRAFSIPAPRYHALQPQTTDFVASHAF
jgi:hypothetical protein